MKERKKNASKKEGGEKGWRGGREGGRKEGRKGGREGGRKEVGGEGGEGEESWGDIMHLPWSLVLLCAVS